MITLTKTDGTAVFVHPERVEWVETCPDSVVVLCSGERLRVRETLAEIVNRIAAVQSPRRRHRAPAA